MRLLLCANHRYPAFREVGAGRNPKIFPSGSGFFIHDLIAKGLGELGHEVFYLLPHGADKPLPRGVTLVTEPMLDADVVHTIAYHEEKTIDLGSLSCPWVTTCHLDLEARGKTRSPTTDNWIFVSRTLARLHGRDRYVLNGIDPADYIYSENKSDYFLFLSTMDWGMEKGLDVALALAEKARIKLIVAGTGIDRPSIERVAVMCRKAGAVYVGDVKGRRKAEFLACAKALLFPTRLNEAFGLGMAEALMSGTPVICSDRGACPEVISPEVGFVCRNWEDYLTAIRRIGEISPRACRDKAMKDYHYLRMAADYVREYQREIDRHGN
jgi:glycosyltransferase involved in cell wall biosynthesis